MKFIHRIAVVSVALIGALCAQTYPWPGNGNNVWWTSGNVGIGTTSPAAQLDVSGTFRASGNAYFTGAALHTDGYAVVPSIGFWTNVNGLGIFRGGVDVLGFATASTERMRIDQNGNVGIGTLNPGQCGGSNTQPCLLTVDGAIGAKEVVVTSGISADYVFDPEYRLRPLPEVAAYVKEHHHLPEIPSAAEVKAKGVSVGEMQAKLLAKIEELTLHLIQADEKNRELQERVARLEAGSR